jgi:regulator of sirC expression with transglutaminase-like and TPR domain
MAPMTDAERRAALAACVRRGSRPRELAKACLLVARGEYPRLDPTVTLAELDRLAGRVRETIASGVRPAWRALTDVLGGAEGFRGSVDDYDNPENSYLNRVLAHRHGLPILLSIVWIEVARGAGIPAAGIGLPGRFLMVAGRGRRAQILDPFAGGAPLSPDDAVALAVEATGDATLTAERLLVPATPREIMLRVLTNLAAAYDRRGDVKRQVRIVSDQIALADGDPGLLARRGELRARQDDVHGGLEDMNRALARLPAGSAFDRVHESARRIARLTESAN